MVGVGEDNQRGGSSLAGWWGEFVFILSVNTKRFLPVTLLLLLISEGDYWEAYYGEPIN